MVACTSKDSVCPPIVILNKLRDYGLLDCGTM